MSDKVLLRKLSKKSILKGLVDNYMENQLVEVVLKIQPKKLAYIYFNYEKITFTDDILEELGIKDKYEIPKPSKDTNRGCDYFMDKIREMTDKERIAKYGRINRTAKVNIEQNERIRDNRNRKINLQRKNHGK